MITILIIIFPSYGKGIKGNAIYNSASITLRMCTINFCFLIAVCTFIAVQGEIVTGSCPNQTVNSDFDLEKFKGIWYEIKSYPKDNKEDHVSCATGELIYRNNELIFEFSGIMANGTHFNQQLKTTHIRGSSFSIDTGGELSADKPNYNVLRVDYAKSAIVWFCQPEENSHVEMYWVLSRTKNLDETEYKNYFENIDINIEDLQTSDQSEKCEKVND